MNVPGDILYSCLADLFNFIEGGFPNNILKELASSTLYLDQESYIQFTFSAFTPFPSLFPFSFSAILPSFHCVPFHNVKRPHKCHLLETFLRIPPLTSPLLLVHFVSAHLFLCSEPDSLVWCILPPGLLESWCNVGFGHWDTVGESRWYFFPPHSLFWVVVLQ